MSDKEVVRLFKRFVRINFQSSFHVPIISDFIVQIKSIYVSKELADSRERELIYFSIYITVIKLNFIIIGNLRN